MGTQITDAGLAHLEPLALAYLEFPESAKTDIGMKHYIEALAPDTIVEYFPVKPSGWKLTDDGLVHLKGLTNLQTLDLIGCEKITDSGVAELQKALPNCEIIRDEFSF
jgi:hypothetical protein